MDLEPKSTQKEQNDQKGEIEPKSTYSLCPDPGPNGYTIPKIFFNTRTRPIQF